MLYESVMKMYSKITNFRAFDAELLYLAERFKIPLKEVAVNWQEIDGSKLTPFWSWLQMGTDLFLMWFRYAIGAWQIHEKSK